LRNLAAIRFARGDQQRGTDSRELARKLDARLLSSFETGGAVSTTSTWEIAFPAKNLSPSKTKAVANDEALADGFNKSSRAASEQAIQTVNFETIDDSPPENDAAAETEIPNFLMTDQIEATSIHAYESLETEHKYSWQATTCTDNLDTHSP